MSAASEIDADGLIALAKINTPRSRTETRPDGKRVLTEEDAYSATGFHFSEKKKW